MYPPFAPPFAPNAHICHGIAVGTTSFPWVSHAASILSHLCVYAIHRCRLSTPNPSRRPRLPLKFEVKGMCLVPVVSAISSAYSRSLTMTFLSLPHTGASLPGGRCRPPLCRKGHRPPIHLGPPTGRLRGRPPPGGDQTARGTPSYHWGQSLLRLPGPQPR